MKRYVQSCNCREHWKVEKEWDGKNESRHEKKNVQSLKKIKKWDMLT